MTTDNREIAPANESFSLISSQMLLSLYSSMLRCRSIAALPANGRRNVNSVLGHEAAAVGSAIGLLADDAVVSALWPDEALRAINPFVSIAPSISAVSRSALGNGNGRRIIVLFSNNRRGAQSPWTNALTLAASHNLPFLFVRLSGPEASREIAAHEALPTNGKKKSPPLIAVDGNDVVAVYRVASEAIAHARKGNGPTLIDCRLSNSGDPLTNMEAYLRGKGLEPAKQ